MKTACTRIFSLAICLVLLLSLIPAYVPPIKA